MDGSNVARPGSLVPARPVRGRHGAVVAPHPLATAAGAAILRDGGHAVDAAIATNAALAVVTAHMCGVGGDAFWLIWDAAGQRALALNGSGRAGSLANPDAVGSRGFDEMPSRGPLSITVPGAVHSWGEAHARFGRLPLARLLEPAIELAEAGFPAGEMWIRSVTLADGIYREALGDAADGWRRTFLPDGRPPRPGEIVHLPALGRTLRRVADAGVAEFYQGLLAERQAAALAAAGSFVTFDDLRDHRSTWTDAIATRYRNVTVTSHPPNSSGVVALELLNILGRFDPPNPASFGPAGPELRWVHLIAEAAKLALADRDVFVTDPDAFDVPVEWLLSGERARALAARIDPKRAAALPSSLPGGGGTVYLATVDREGNAVSLIESNFSGFGSGIVDPETGIAYQNRGAYFRLDQSYPNCLAPRKRTLHTLLPLILFRDGQPWVVGGSMGGDAQPAIAAQLVSGLVDGGLDVATAVSAPRVSAEASRIYGPRDTLVAEPRFRAGLLDGLAAMGHKVVVAEPFDSALGHCHAIELVAGGTGPGGAGGPIDAMMSLAAATDPRSEGVPAVL